MINEWLHPGAAPRLAWTMDMRSNESIIVHKEIAPPPPLPNFIVWSDLAPRLIAPI